MPRSKLLICLFSVIFLTFLFPHEAYTEEEERFDTKYFVTYNILPNGETQVTQNISIINKTDESVATKFTLIVNDLHLYDILGTDSKGPLKITVEERTPSTIINVDFNEQVIGKGRKNDWQLSYKTKDIATKVGEIWHTNIPKVEVLDTTQEYEITLKIPKTFGPKIFLSPLPTEEKEEIYLTQYKFNKENLVSTGISASFGSYQVLNFKLKYHLYNQSSFSSYQEIALPPDIPKRQQVYFKQIDPLPLETYQDTGGNFMAKYKIKPGESLVIKAIGSVRILGKQIRPEFGGTPNEIPTDISQRYTGSEKYWETNSQVIKRIAKNLYNSELTVSENARKAYDYVVSNLQYNFNLEKKDYITRQGALVSLTSSEKWGCMEFTDAFIALARAMKIPARELNGYALTQESNLTPLSIDLRGGDFLHSWAEFYDPNFGWVPVDPTWGHTSKTDYFTKLDTSHFVFAIKGLDSEGPLPAGTYKTDLSENQKQTEVDVAQDPNQYSFSEHISYSLSDGSLSTKIHKLFKTQKITVYNDGGVAVYDFNGTGKTLLPYHQESFYIKKDKIPSYTCFYGEIKSLSQSWRVKEETSVRKSSSSQYLISVTLALALCMTIYGAAVHQPVRQKLSALRHLLRRGQGQ